MRFRSRRPSHHRFLAGGTRRPRIPDIRVPRPGGRSSDWWSDRWSPESWVPTGHQVKLVLLLGGAGGTVRDHALAADRRAAVDVTIDSASLRGDGRGGGIADTGDLDTALRSHQRAGPDLGGGGAEGKGGGSERSGDIRQRWAGRQDRGGRNRRHHGFVPHWSRLLPFLGRHRGRADGGGSTVWWYCPVILLAGSSCCICHWIWPGIRPSPCAGEARVATPAAQTIFELRICGNGERGLLST